jgi:hypothetical protein
MAVVGPLRLLSGGNQPRRHFIPMTTGGEAGGRQSKLRHSEVPDPRRPGGRRQAAEPGRPMDVQKEQQPNRLPPSILEVLPASLS